jgi:hypothetical protein
MKVINSWALGAFVRLMIEPAMLVIAAINLAPADHDCLFFYFFITRGPFFL